MNLFKAAASAFLMTIACSSANALTFQFDITNVEGNFDGSITGVVSGLVDDAVNQQAASVILQTAPSSMPGILPGPIDFVKDFGAPLLNSFSVSDGRISQAQFAMQVLNADLPDVDPDVFESVLFVINAGAVTNCCGVLNNGITFDNTLNFLGNDNGNNGVEFSNVSAVPLPATGWLMFGSIFGIGALRKNWKNVQQG